MKVVIPGYEIQKELGRGGMATVYLAIQKSLERPVALKILPPLQKADPAFLNRFLKEGRAAASLEHRHIITVYDAGVSDETCYFAMEYVQGGNLKERIARGLSEQESLQILSHIAQALDYAHRKGVVHRDIKPENILFRADGTCALADFGIAGEVGPGTRMTSVGLLVGSPHYMSPEQAEGEGELDHRSDLYSLGIVLHEMLTGQVPFDGDSPIRIALKHIREDSPRLPGPLAHLQPVLNRLLAKRPEQRFGGAEELLAALKPLLTAQDGDTRKENPADAPPVIHVPIEPEKAILSETGPEGPLPQRRTGRLAIAALLAAGALGTLLYFIPHRSTPAISEPIRQETAPAKAVPVAASSPSATADFIDLAQTGSAALRLSGDPSDAMLFLNGKKLGPLPYDRQDLPAGKVRIRLESPYCKPFETTLTLVENDTQHQEFKLERQTGNLVIETDPIAAVLTMDGKQQAVQSPMTLNDLGAGFHDIMLTAGDCRNYQGRVEVLPGKTTRLNIELPGENLLLYNDRCLPETEVVRLKKEAASAQSALTVTQLLEAASRDIRANRFTTPAGNNALAKYREIFRLAPNHSEAMTGVEQLVAGYLEFADRALGERELDKVRTFVTQAGNIAKDFPSATSKRRLAEWERYFSNCRQGYKWLAGRDKDRAVAAFEQALAVQPAGQAARSALAQARDIKQPGAIFSDRLSDGSDGPVMVALPAGTFAMGDSTPGGNPGEQPVKKVHLARPFAIGRYEVTFDDYAQFCRAKNRPLPDDHGWGRGKRPVIGISWQDAAAYASWLEKQTGKPYRLPTEAEWEYAAKAGSTSSQWWRNSASEACQGANIYDEAGHAASETRQTFPCSDRYAFTAPAGSFKSNGFGLYDVNGNVMEWCLDSFNRTLATVPADGQPRIETGTAFKVVRGSSWSSPRSEGRVTLRMGKNKDFGYENVGFRLARDL